MNTYSRRDIGRFALAGIAAPALFEPKAFAQKVDGVQLGVCTYSFRSLPPGPNGDSVDPVVAAMKECGATSCELFSPQLEPANPILQSMMSATTPEARAALRARMNGPESKKIREDLRQWRLSTPASHFESVRKKFKEAGIDIYSYTINYRDDFTDGEIDKTFGQAKALGATNIAASTTLTMANRLAPFADKHKFKLALHGHSNVKDPNEFSSPETFEKALAMSDWFRINLDIGHFAAANFDPVAYLEKQHEKITHLHMKDRKKNDGPNEPFGEGETPIKEVLALLKSKRYKIPAFIEYEYKGAGTPVEEVKKALAYEKAALAS